MQITTGRLRIVPISMAHLESTHAYSSDPENTGFMMFLPYASLVETQTHIREAETMWTSEAPGYLEFVILRDGENIGGITVYFLEPHVAELGWILDKACWGRGYASQAVRAVMAHGRQAWGIRRYIAMCDSENAASIALMKRLGMRSSGVTGVRKNRSSDEERVELIYQVDV
ncbi:MAG: GNAT family N-acetyltransferase [Clostridia bacterium]|nr:GNAT family N-acetyltransferase [Clostridia bacterium]